MVAEISQRPIHQQGKKIFWKLASRRVCGCARRTYQLHPLSHRDFLWSYISATARADKLQRSMSRVV